MEFIGIMFGIFGLVALARVESLIRELKSKGVLDADYKDK
jgi:hypothetical protein